MAHRDGPGTEAPTPGVEPAPRGRARRLMAVAGAFAAVALVATACSSDPTPTATPDDAVPTAVAAGIPTPTSGTDPGGSTPVASNGSATISPSSGSNPRPPRSVSGKPIDPDARSGGILRTAATMAGPSYSTWEEVSGIAFATMHPLHNMLVQTRTWGAVEDFHQNDFFEIHPDLAETWTVSPNGLDHRFTLRDGIEWSDSTPLTCADVKWSYDSIRTGSGLTRSPRAGKLAGIARITCVSDLTIVFSLNFPMPGILEALAQPYNVIRPRHVYQNDTRALRTALPTVTTGPFRMGRSVEGEIYSLIRNLEYWDEPFPYLDGIEILVMAEASLPTMLRSGRLDIGAAEGFTGSPAEELIADCAFCVFWPRVIAPAHGPSMMMNHTRRPWNEPAVKQAFALAIDNDKYVQNVRQGWSLPPTGCGLYPTSGWAMPAARCAKITGYSDFIGASTPRTDKSRARQLLADAGFDQGELSVSVRFWSGIEEDAPSIIDDLQAIGVNATAEILNTADALQAWSDGDFDVGVDGFQVNGLDPDTLLHEHFYTGASRNYNGYSSVEFDRLADEMSRTVDAEQRRELAWSALEIALKDQAKIIVAHPVYVPVFHERVRGVMPAVDYLALYGPQARHDHTWLLDDGTATS